MGLAMPNREFVKTPLGMAIAGEAIFGVLGGVVNFFIPSLGSGLLGFCFWASAIISLVFLLLHMCNMIQTAENAYPIFTKCELGYVGLFVILYLVGLILSLVPVPNIIAVFVIPPICAFGVDGYLKYQKWKNPPSQTESSAQAAKTGPPV